MEKEPTIETELEKNTKMPEPKQPQIELPQTLEKIEKWKNEGGSVGIEETTSSEEDQKPEIPKHTEAILPLDKEWGEIMAEHIDEFPENIQEILIKNLASKKLKDKEKNQLKEAKNHWWKINGLKFGAWKKRRNNYLESLVSKERTTSKDGKARPEIKPEEISGSLSFRMMLEARGEFIPRVEQLLNKMLRGKITNEEMSILAKARNEWFKNIFGVNFEQRLSKKTKGKIVKFERNTISGSKGGSESRRVRHTRNLSELGVQKMDRMEKLHEAIKNLDNGEPVNEFLDEARRILYYNEHNNQYYIEEDDKRKYFKIGDITSDYAWGIKYVPEGEMIEPAYHRIAKRILTNEARRDLEGIHDRELIRAGMTPGTSSKDTSGIEKRWRNNNWKERGTLIGQMLYLQ